MVVLSWGKVNNLTNFFIVKINSVIERTSNVVEQIRITIVVVRIVIIGTNIIERIIVRR